MSCGLDLRLPAISCRDVPLRGHIDMKLMCISLNDVKSATPRAAPSDPKIASDRTIKHNARMRLMILSWVGSSYSQAVVKPCRASRAAWHVLLKTWWSHPPIDLTIGAPKNPGRHHDEAQPRNGGA